MAIIVLDLPTTAELDDMTQWLVDNVGPINKARTQSSLARWGTNWWMKAMMIKGELKWQAFLPDDTMAVMFRLACSK